MTQRPIKPWFAAKRYGYGSGLPIAWQGWLLVGLYLALVIMAPIALAPLLSSIVVIAATAILLVICARKTAGGWRWRNGRL